MSLDRLLGSWQFTMQHVAVAEPVTGRQGYERVLDGAFVLLRWHYDREDFPDALAVLDDRSYHYFDVRGVIRLFDVEMSDAGWSMIRRDEDFWQRSALTFDGADAMVGHGENSYDDGATWQHDYVIRLVRA